MQVNSLTIFIIRQNLLECQSDEAAKHARKIGYNVSSSSQSKQKSQKLLKHLKVWFNENEDKQIFQKIDTNTQTSSN